MGRGNGDGRDVGGADGGGEGVGLQREMGLVSGISLIVGRERVPFFSSSNSLMGFAYLSLSIIEQSLAKNIERGGS